MSLSAVPAAVDALLAILRTGLDPNELTVMDGPALTDVPGDVVFVGYQPGDSVAVNVQQAFAYAGARRRDEEFLIHGLIESRSGDTDMQARRARTFEILGLIETALRATDAQPTAPTLNGTVLWAHLTSGDLTQEQTPDGAVVGLAWTISCQARI
ncbi:hypothetical protein [Streptomyces sp. NPDC005760]|uniref:hypothetical protein n=1 Tax=Streptomyces sp. NPDC005760 TaxID=3156718 RepID=UPI0033E8620A